MLIAYEHESVLNATFLRSDLSSFQSSRIVNDVLSSCCWCDLFDESFHVSVALGEIYKTSERSGLPDLWRWSRHGCWWRAFRGLQCLCFSRLQTLLRLREERRKAILPSVQDPLQEASRLDFIWLALFQSSLSRNFSNAIVRVFLG